MGTAIRQNRHDPQFQSGERQQKFALTSRSGKSELVFSSS